MKYLDMINSRLTQYEEKVDFLMKNKGKFDGVFGLGHHPKNDPCHIEFYNDIKKITEDIADDPSVTAEETDAVVEIIIKADSVKNSISGCTLMYVPMQGLAVPLISGMSEAKRNELGAWYSENNPRRMRLPVQNDVCKAFGVK